jgi:hypothetical protein
MTMTMTMTKCEVRSTKFEVRSTRFEVRSTEFEVLVRFATALALVTTTLGDGATIAIRAVRPSAGR